MAPFNSKAVANFLLELAAAQSEQLTPMKLQKLVYYAHGWCLALTGKPLINEAVQAWSFGPVVRSLYDEFRDFGANPITRPAMEIVYLDGEKTESRCPRLDDNKEADVGFAKSLLKRIWEVFGRYSAVQLSNMTHAPGTAWDRLNKFYSGNIPKYATIPDEWIREEFTSKENPA